MSIKNKILKKRYGVPAFALILLMVIATVTIATTGYMLYTDSDSVVIKEPKDIEMNVTGDEVVWGEWSESDATLTNNEDAIYKVEGNAVFNVDTGDSEPTDIQVVIQYDDGDWVTMWDGTAEELDGKEVRFGPEDGWEIEPGYDETTNYRIGAFGTPDDDLRIDYTVSADVIQVVSPLE